MQSEIRLLMALKLKKDDFMGISEGKIIISAPSLEEVMKTLLASLIDEDDEIVTILYGEDVRRRSICDCKLY